MDFLAPFTTLTDFFNDMQSGRLHQSTEESIRQIQEARAKQALANGEQLHDTVMPDGRVAKIPEKVFHLMTGDINHTGKNQKDKTKQGEASLEDLAKGLAREKGLDTDGTRIILPDGYNSATGASASTGSEDYAESDIPNTPLNLPQLIDPEQATNAYIAQLKQARAKFENGRTALNVETTPVQVSDIALRMAAQKLTDADINQQNANLNALAKQQDMFNAQRDRDLKEAEFKIRAMGSGSAGSTSDKAVDPQLSIPEHIRKEDSDNAKSGGDPIGGLKSFLVDAYNMGELKKEGDKLYATTGSIGDNERVENISKKLSETLFSGKPIKVGEQEVVVEDLLRQLPREKQERFVKDVQEVLYSESLFDQNPIVSFFYNNGAKSADEVIATRITPLIENLLKDLDSYQTVYETSNGKKIK